MKRVAAILALLWCLPHLVVAFWMVQGAFVAKTAMHEGVIAQFSLLAGGLLIAVFTLFLARLCVQIVLASSQPSGA
jgi:hypothetical protein